MDLPLPIIVSQARDQIVGVHEMRVSMIRVEFNGPLKFFFSGGPIPFKICQIRESDVGIGECVVKL